MRSYKILAHKAKIFAADKEIQGLINKGQTKALEKYSAAGHKKLMAENFDYDKIAEKGSGYEKLDQMLFDLMMGLRG
jgi:xylose isomerase